MLLPRGLFLPGENKRAAAPALWLVLSMAGAGTALALFSGLAVSACAVVSGVFGWLAGAASACSAAASAAVGLFRVPNSAAKVDGYSVGAAVSVG